MVALSKVIDVKGEVMKSYQIGLDNIGEETLVGQIHLTPPTYPIPHGNCFSVEIDNKYIQIANMHVENFREWFRINNFKSVNINVDELGNGFIDDKNVGNDWYLEEYCSSCYRR